MKFLMMMSCQSSGKETPHGPACHRNKPTSRKLKLKCVALNLNTKYRRHNRGLVK